MQNVLDLTTAWKSYLKERRLKIILDVNHNNAEQLIDILNHIKFKEVRIPTQVFATPENDKKTLTTEGFEVVIEYLAATKWKNAKEFTLGKYFYWDHKEVEEYETYWQINEAWYEQFMEPGLSVLYHFEYFGLPLIKNELGDIIEDLFEGFQLADKIRLINDMKVREKIEERLKKQMQFIEKNNNSTVQTIVENEQLYVVFSNGKKHKIELE